jgi:hypothetical protein
MIRYTLVCNKRHEFESWFQDSAAYDKQAKRGLVACPMCGSVKVEKTIMKPQLARRDKKSVPIEAPKPIEAPTAEASTTANVPALPEPPAPVAMISPQEQEFRTKLKELRDHLVKNAENVGPRFPEEARKMHYGEADPRSIYGIASPDEARELSEEGIAFSPLPVLPDERN